MRFIDTHSHLYSSQFDQDRTKVVENAINVGIDKILLPNISSKYTKGMNDLCDEFPDNCFAMMGLHPCDVKTESYEREIQHIEEELSKGKYIAVGEIGLDLYWDKSTLELQKEAFIYQIELAKKIQLPVVIHIRNSFTEAIEIIEKLNDPDLSGVLHCFTGNFEEAQRVIDLDNFYLGIGGVLTFKNSGLDKTIEKIKMSHLVLETDSPYLAPTPNRGKRNESKYLISIAEKLSHIHQISIEEVAKVTTENAELLFQL